MDIRVNTISLTELKPLELMNWKGETYYMAPRREPLTVDLHLTINGNQDRGKLVAKLYKVLTELHDEEGADFKDVRCAIDITAR